MLSSFREILDERRRRGAAAGAFTCYDVTTALGVLRAAEERSAPVLLLLSSASFEDRDGAALLLALRAVGQRSPAPVCVQLDHVSDEVTIRRALDLGVGAIMADGSHLPRDENAALVQRVREASSGVGAGIEVELGHIEGDEDVVTAIEARALTDPDEAALFVQDTSPDCLAVSIGNVHGTYTRPPQLDWDRLDAIRFAVGDLPLSLHGASGIADGDLRRAIAAGVCKVNFNTEIRTQYLAEIEARLPHVLPGARVLELQNAIVAAVAEVVRVKLDQIEGS